MSARLNPSCYQPPLMYEDIVYFHRECPNCRVVKARGITENPDHLTCAFHKKSYRNNCNYCRLTRRKKYLKNNNNVLRSILMTLCGQSKAYYCKGAKCKRGQNGLISPASYLLYHDVIHYSIHYTCKNCGYIGSDNIRHLRSGTKYLEFNQSHYFKDILKHNKKICYEWLVGYDELVFISKYYTGLREYYYVCGCGTNVAKHPNHIRIISDGCNCRYYNNIIRRGYYPHIKLSVVLDYISRYSSDYFRGIGLNEWFLPVHTTNTLYGLLEYASSMDYAKEFREKKTKLRYNIEIAYNNIAVDNISTNRANNNSVNIKSKLSILKTKLRKLSKRQ